jgi:NAD-dependent dihydropyrimidine dehydrogenase PreA subunit
MIEFVVDDRCTGCGTCVTACPTNVFDFTEAGVPVIARQADCQTCYMCELYCEADALFVASDAHGPEPVDQAAIVASGLLGQFRRDSGWHEWADDPRYENRHWLMGEVFSRARTEGRAP